MENRKGFTLIELLIVVVIIGILAAIAIPKFSATRERAYRSAMQSDLRNLQSSQEIWYADPNNGYEYTNSLEDLEFSESSGVTITFTGATNTGWGATAVHAALPGETCAVFVGDGTAAPATNPGVVTCTEDAEEG
jgi:type IV pilus assembly protein PilA